MEEILEKATVEVGRIAGTLDEKTRKRTINTLRKLQYALEPPEETMQRLIYCNLTLASIKVSLDLKIFDILAKNEGSLSVNDLAERSQSDPVLLGRFLRHQASLGFIEETDQSYYAASNITKSLAMPEIEAGLYFCNDVLGPSFQVLPEFLAENKYQNPEKLLETPFHKAFGTELPIWTWIHQDKRLTSYFNRFMYAQRSITKNCFSFLPIEQGLEGWPAQKASFVDVGGGTGQQCVEIKKKFPAIPGRIILQDLRAVVDEANFPDELGIEKMEYDFFTEQPVKGAKYYYLRAIMHDHADKECLEILSNTAEAMTEESILLLDEIVVPNSNVDWFVTQTDLAMLVQFSAIERTEEHWRRLLSEAGLSVHNITTYTFAHQLSIITCKKVVP